MPTFKPGDRVRFTKGPLGLVLKNNNIAFVERLAEKGDEGVVTEWQSNLEGWLYVDVGDGLFCPVHPHLIEHV